jgi:hypothetical protein
METDAASGNLKLIAHLINLLPDDQPQHMIESSLCHSHQNHHIENAMTAIIGLDVLRRLFLVCQFLSSSTHFSRLRICAKGWVSSLCSDRPQWMLQLSPALANCMFAYYEATFLVFPSRIEVDEHSDGSPLCQLQLHRIIFPPRHAKPVRIAPVA